MKPQDIASVFNSMSNLRSEELLTVEKLHRPVGEFVALEDSFAVVLVGGHQYKVTKGDELMVDRLLVPVLSDLLLDKVLMVGSQDQTALGRPLLPQAKVRVEVQEHSRTEKIRVLRKKKRSRSSRRLLGHRQPYSLLKVIDILIAKAE